MMIVGKHRVKSYMSMEYDFSGIRLIDAVLSPVDWHISVNLVALDKKGKGEDAELNANIAYQRLYFWLDTNLPNIIMVNVANEDDLYIANLSSNLMMYCPEEPYDDLIVQLIHSKLTALADGNLLVGEVKIKASDMTVQYSFEAADMGYNLPATTEEYYTEGKARDKLPWWSRNDGFSFEFIRPENVQITDEELYKDIVDPMEEFSRVMEEASDRAIGVAKEPARIVQVEKWKPKKV